MRTLLALADYYCDGRERPLLCHYELLGYGVTVDVICEQMAKIWAMPWTTLKAMGDAIDYVCFIILYFAM